MGPAADGFQAYLDACTGSDFQRIVLIDGPAVLGHGAWGDLVEQHGLGLLRTRLQRAVDDGQIDPLPIHPPRPAPRRSHRRSQPLHRACPDPARAHREASATIDRILSGLRPATGS